jgi:hypothetical protein
MNPRWSRIRAEIELSSPALLIPFCQILNQAFSLAIVLNPFNSIAVALLLYSSSDILNLERSRQSDTRYRFAMDVRPKDRRVSEGYQTLDPPDVALGTGSSIQSPDVESKALSTSAASWTNGCSSTRQICANRSPPKCPEANPTRAH